LKNPHTASGPAGVGLQKAKSRRIRIFSTGLAALGLTALLFGGSRHSGSILGITLVILGGVALASSIIAFALAASLD
jgi:hypothetical protein